MSLTKQIVSISELFRAPKIDIKNEGDATRDNLQRRFLAQHSVATLFQHCNAVLHDYNFGAVVMRNIDLLCARSIIVPSLLLHNLFMSLNLRCARDLANPAPPYTYRTDSQVRLTSRVRN